jgi:thioredoxin 1|tara:strand:- start:171 stop:557 length:387 start_codon:yes stop_codon:yes gene_type:complete
MKRDEESVKRVVVAEGFAVPVDEKQFEHMVATSAKPVLVDFWADWCGPCKSMAPVLDDFAAKYADDMQVIKVEADKSPLLMERFDVTNIPTLMVFVDGKVQHSAVGAMPLDMLEKELGSYIAVETKEV